jgi:hypothetical protein
LLGLSVPAGTAVDRRFIDTAEIKLLINVPRAMKTFESLNISK